MNKIVKTVNPVQQAQHDEYNNTLPHLASHVTGLNTTRNVTTSSVNHSFVSIPQQQQQQRLINNSIPSSSVAATTASTTRRNVHSAANCAHSTASDTSDNVANAQMRYSYNDFPVHRNVIASSAMPVSQSANFDRATLRQTSETQSLPAVNQSTGASLSFPQQQKQQQQ